MIKAGTTAFNLIMRYARKRLAAPNAEGIMEVMSNKQAMDFVKDLVNEFNRFGVPESAITKVDDVGKFANQIVDIKQQRLMQEFKKQMTPKKSADIIELQTGKKIDQSKGIIGGRQFEETEDQIKARIDKSNKETIARMKMVDDAIEDASPGFSGDTKIDAELVAENLAERRGLVYDDLSTRERIKIYGEAFDAISKKFRDDLATGGRAGFDKGGMSRRKFMQIMGGLAALPVVGKFFKTGKVAAPVVEKAAEAASGAPSYFFDLVEKIKLLGVRSKGFKERSESFRYKDYDMDIDYDTGDIQIKKTREAMIPGGDEAGIAEESIMVYRPGRADELTKGKTPPDEYDEYTARPDMDGKMKDVDDGLSENVEKEIMEEVSEGGGNVDELTLQEIKKDKLASGGRVGLLSGGGVIRVMLKKLAERYGKKPSELLAVTNYKSLPVEVRKFLTKEQFELIKKDMQASRVEQFENLRDMVKSRQEFDRSAEALKKMGMDISDTMLPLMNKAVAPSGTTADDLLMMEQVIKNLRMKDRKLNASGGLAGMLGE